MSQIFGPADSSPPTPSVDTLTGDTGTNPVGPDGAFNINVFGRDTTENNNNGIQTEGDAAANTLYVELTNRVQGIASTSGVATAAIITFTPTVVGTYSFEFRIAVYNETSLLGAGYSLFGAIRFDGVNSNICDIFDEIVNEEGTMTNLDIAVSVAGANVLLNGTGYLGQEINWAGVGLYTFIGAI